MSEAPEAIHLHPAGPPSRCPFCHAEVDREAEAWVACEACLAPHHAACWREGGACAGCGERRCVGDGTAEASPGAAPPEGAAAASADPGPALELELRGRRAHFEGPLTGLHVHVAPKEEAWLEVRVTNATDRPAHVTLRRLPPWLDAASRTVEVGPGKVGALRAVLGDPAVRGRVLGGGIERGELVLAADEDQRAVPVLLHLAPAAARTRRLRRFALAACLGALIFPYAYWAGSVRTRRITALATHGVTATGWVSRLTPRDHDQVYVRYAVGERTYEVHGYAHGERIGQQVRVTYLPSDPAVAVRGRDFASYSGAGWYMLPFVALMFSAVGIAVSALKPTAPTRGS